MQTPEHFERKFNFISHIFIDMNQQNIDQNKFTLPGVVETTCISVL